MLKIQGERAASKDHYTLCLLLRVVEGVGRGMPGGGGEGKERREGLI